MNKICIGVRNQSGVGGLPRNEDARTKCRHEGAAGSIQHVEGATRMLGVRWGYHFTYQSECRDHRLQERHWVSVHRWRHAGQTPPVSNVFHSCPQVQNHRSSLRGDQPQSGHRIRGPDGSWLFSSSSRSKTTEDLPTSLKTVEIPARRTADPEPVRVPRVRSIPRRRSPRDSSVC